MVDHGSAVPSDGFSDTTLKRGDRVAHVLKTGAVRGSRRSDHLAGHGGDLPAFGVAARGWRRVRNGGDRPRRDGIRACHWGRDNRGRANRGGDNRGGEAITAAGHGLDPTFAAGNLAEDLA